MNKLSKGIIVWAIFCWSAGGAFGSVPGLDWDVVPALGQEAFFMPVNFDSADVGELVADFLDRCRQGDEIVPDAEYERVIGLCMQERRKVEGASARKDASPMPIFLMKDFFRLRFDEIEIFTFWAIDGYLGDLVKIHTAQALMSACEKDLKNAELWDRDAFLTGRFFYLQASLKMLEAHRLGQFPRFEEVLPLLERARELFSSIAPKDEILVLNTLGRSYSELAFDKDASEERYLELTGKAEKVFRSALALSLANGDFMRTGLTMQLGNILNNMDKSAEALEMLTSALDLVNPELEPNRLLMLRLDIVQVLTGRYMESSSPADLEAVELGLDEALKASDSLSSDRGLPHVRFNLAMSLFMIAEETRDTRRNAQAIREMEKVLEVWTFERYVNLHLMTADTLGHFLDVQESLTREVFWVDKAIELILGITSRFQADASLLEPNRKVLSNLYERLSELYFKRALHEVGEKQQEAYDLSVAASKRAEELRTGG